MDKVQPMEHQLQAEQFMKEKIELQSIKSSASKEKDNDEIIFTPIRLYDCESPLDDYTLSLPGNASSFRHVPRVIVTMENDPLDHFPLPDFDNLWKVSLFMMSYTGKSTCKIFTPCGGILFKGIYPRAIFCQSCQSELTESRVEIVDPNNLDVMMLLRYTTPPYQICYEEETTVVEILEPDDTLMATIFQKKTWMNARISRNVTIEPAYGKANSYRAEFNWNDTSVDFKTTRSGLVVATLAKNCTDKNTTTAYALQILREVKPRDKAILVGFMIARDILMIDERQTRDMVGRITAFFVFIFAVAVLIFFLKLFI